MELYKLNMETENQLFYLEDELLKIFLKDNTTKKNLIWSTNEYKFLGVGYDANSYIEIDKIKKYDLDIIKPRNEKTEEVKLNRSRDKAEVFTPSWICNMQNNLIDNNWFNSENMFNTESEKSWETNYQKIEFPRKEEKNWKSYIKANRLEITCGEAPYLVSRYDAVTGTHIKVIDRIGFLDRKLRVVSENTKTSEEWIKWSKRAVKAIYGYDYQGDNVLIARLNIFYTIIDFYEHKFNKQLSLEELIKFAKIIVWNIWQMDGLKFVVPNSHKGLLKIGETSINEKNISIDKLSPNTAVLNKAAKSRINQYTSTAGIKYKLLHTELAIKQSINSENELHISAFRDYEVHNVISKSGYKQVKIDETSGKEWFKITLDKAIESITAVKENRSFIKNENKEMDFTAVNFRPEQVEAIKKTIKQFKKNDKMLWNAKMRFGKTLSTLEVVKKMQFKKTIIVTHRPVVSDGWYEDFRKIFSTSSDYLFGSRGKDKLSIKELEDSCNNYVYFASVQDLRGSDKVGGKLDKNVDVFNIEWDFVVIDEAHEGTTTSLGEKVVEELIKSNEDTKSKTKLLALSGTPFNIMGQYKEEELYTWDYVMEQSAKKDYAINNFGDSNPYSELPQLNIYTYNLGNNFNKSNYQELEDKAFNFREFFRTWTGNADVDYKVMPSDALVGDFVHKQDIISFLNLISKEDKTNYPYANEEFRNLFKHSLWMLPGVKEARALSKLLSEHDVFGSNGQFDIVNVAGDGDDDEESKDALKNVKDAISEAQQNNTYTITLSCGKLTTGVTIPEWTAVLMLSGSYSTSAANYLQTIFRVQSPANIKGMIKENCYVFDFAPDRTLKMVASSVNLSSKAGNTSKEDRVIMGEFLNFCPVIAIDGTKMQKYNENNLLQELKKAYAERAVKNGFDDTSIYNIIELSKLTEKDLEKFVELKKIVGSNKTQPKTDELTINDTGLTDEEHEEIEKIEKKSKKERTLEEQKKIDEAKEIISNRAKAISNLRALSIRIPLLIYGIDIDFEDDISAEKFVNSIDDLSWSEFMPNNLTKDMFKVFIKYYDADVFIGAGRKIRNIIKYADTLPPTQRIQKIAELFNNFKNPDKETVLTPWRVVNMHMGDCLGGYNFLIMNIQTL